MVDVDERAVGAERVADRKFRERIGDDAGRRLPRIENVGAVAGGNRAVTEEQFVGEQLLLAVENRLAAEENLLSLCFRHGAIRKARA